MPRFWYIQVFEKGGRRVQIKECYLTKNPYYTRNVYQVDNRYTTFQIRGPLGLMLHSVGCAQPNALVFITNWNKPSYENACVHGFIDANSGIIYQTMPWNFRAPHCAGSGNNTHIGVEMCESSYIRYYKVGEVGYAPGKFEIINKNKAQDDCKRAYNAAVELFAMLCKKYKLDPLKDICSHKEGHAKGIASNHGDPEHYWTQLGMPYSMNGFRSDVKAVMDGGSIIAPVAPANPTPVPATGGAIEKGMLVKLASDAVYYTGKPIPSWVKALKWYVRSVAGDRAIIDKCEDGHLSIMSAVNTMYLTDVTPPTVKPGALVEIAEGATYYSGKPMPAWVIAKRWYVKSMDGDRVVIDKSEDGSASIMSAVNKKFLTAVR